MIEAAFENGGGPMANLVDDHANVLQGFWRFMLLRMKFWLLPVLITMAVFGGLMLHDHLLPREPTPEAARKAP